MNNTYTQTNDSNAAEVTQPAWWTVRRSLLATLGALSLLLVALITPTPLAKWVFGDSAILVARR